MFLHRVGSVISPLRGLLSAKTTLPLVQNAQNVSSKSAEERLGLPPKPKKPLTPYFRFMKEIRPKILAENNQISMTDVLKNVAKQWATVDDVRRQKYQEEFKKDQAVYLQKMTQYKSKLTDEQKENIQIMKESIAEAKEKREFRKKLRQLGKPKRPQSAFLIFLNDERKKNPQKGAATREWLNEAAAKWTNLPQKTKDTYVQVSTANREKYQEELGKWEKQMVKQGHLDVVRQEALIEDRPPKPSKRSAKP
ncbi:transcription factor A, mitochondrial [Lutzomyia longipalpis]|uniref:transcription factor A, mitochondrial n=1 Tax=Lutzomyia longipalpis TaxID=7200 RepID=UPI0024838F1B|nr:transcription factor A, mitochondrial [Lutzomyia longipalpis]